MGKPKQANHALDMKLGFALLIAIFVAFGVFIIYEMQRTADLNRKIYDHPLVVSNAALQANTSIAKMHRNMKDVVLFKSSSRVQKAIEAVGEEEKNVYLRLDSVRDNILGYQGKVLEQEARKLFSDWRVIRTEVIDLVQNNQGDAAAEITVGKGADHVALLEAKMLGLTNYARNKASTIIESTQKAQSRVTLTSLVFLILGTLVSLVVAFLTLKRHYSASKNLLESEARFKTLSNVTVEGILINHQKIIIDVNDSFARMFGYTREELIGKKGLELLIAQGSQAIVSQNIKNNLTEPYEVVGRKKEGTLFPIEIESRHIITETDNYRVAAFRDISKRKQAEEQLHQSNEREKELAEIVRKAPIAIAYGYPDGNLANCNAAFSSLTQYSIEELQQIKWNEVLTPEKWQGSEVEHLSQLCPTLKSVRYEKEYIRKDGSIVPIELTVTANFDSTGSVTNYIGFITDITARKQIEQKNKMYQQQLITILNSIDANVYVADMETYEILFMNKNMIQDFGQDFTGHICWDVLRKESGPCDFCKKSLLIDENGRPAEGYVWDRKNPVNGKYYINHDRAIEWGDGRLVHLQIATDISDVKLMEQELRQKYKMEAIGVMAGGMAHNFNNNLSIILGNLELTKLKLPDHPEVSTFIDHAKIAVMRSRDLVKQIMTYSRKGEQHNTPLQLSVMVEETITLIKSTIPSSISLQKDIHPSITQTSVLANASQIQELLLNLCNNAVHAMDEQGTLTLKLKPVELKQQQIPAQSFCPPGNYLCLSVQDSGCGMPAEIQEKIFDPFFTTKELYDGTGMGLSTVQGMMEQLHGLITVESTVGQGTTFDLYFPTIGLLNEDDDIIIQELPRGKEHILFVEDDEMLATIAEKMLSEMGYQVTMMTDSLEALKLFTVNAERLDLVITDQTMPDLTGKELILKLKEIRPDIPTIICTGYSSKIDEAEAQTLGADAFMMKPLDLPALLQTIRRVLDGERE